MSYYLDVAASIKQAHPDAARVIEELYAAKVQLEQDVKRISDARDLLLFKEEEMIRRRGWWWEVLECDGTWRRISSNEAGQLCSEGLTVCFRSARMHDAEDRPPERVEHSLMEEERIRRPGWYEKDWDDNGVWSRSTYQEARMLQAKGWSIRFRDPYKVLVLWLFNQRRRRNFQEQPIYVE